MPRADKQPKDIAVKLEGRFERLLKQCKRQLGRRAEETEMISNTIREVKALKEKLAKSSPEEHKAVAREFRLVAKAYRAKKKEFKRARKVAKPGKGGKRPRGRKPGKAGRPGKADREAAKAARAAAKAERALKKERLTNAQLEELPNLKAVNLDTLHILVDGWNIVGCDSIARKCMRGKRGKAKPRMLELLDLFNKKSQYTTDNPTKLTLYFDGNGKDYTFEGMPVIHSGKQEIVDDKLVRELGVAYAKYAAEAQPHPHASRDELSGDDEHKEKEELDVFHKIKNVKNPNRHFLVITSDRELTLRLDAIGVSVMKSGRFYKGYIKPLMPEKADDATAIEKDTTSAAGAANADDRRGARDSPSDESPISSSDYSDDSDFDSSDDEDFDPSTAANVGSAIGAHNAAATVEDAAQYTADVTAPYDTTYSAAFAGSL